MVPGPRTESISAAQPAGAHRKPATRVAELDGLRGIAILLVVVFHFTPTSGPLYLLAHVFQIGWAGVDLFFVLSGYLITGILLDSAGRPHYYRNFLVRRSLRIFPLYYACFLLYAFLTFYPSPIHWHDYLHTGNSVWYLFYVGNFDVFLRNAWPGAAILTPLWSLQVEEQFYWSFPFIVASVRRQTLATILTASVIAALLIRIALAIALPSNLVGAYVLMPCRMDALAMGGLVAVAFREEPEWLKSPRIAWLTVLSAAVFLAVCIFFNETPWSAAMRILGYTALDLAFTGVLILLIGSRRQGLVRLCRLRTLTWLGTISYGLYLLHIPALTVVDRWLAPALHLTPRGSAAFFVSFALAIAAASLSWLAFESQVLRLKNRFAAQ